jgi:hypothetical protein
VRRSLEKLKKDGLAARTLSPQSSAELAVRQMRLGGHAQTS